MNGLKTFLVLLLLVFFGIAGQAQEQKNVLLIAVDDLNDWIGAFGGNDQTLTPNLDALASKSIAFQNASCSSPVCNPSRTAFLTGRRPHETGLVNNDGGRNFRDDPQEWVRNLVTMPEYFSANGYQSVGQGKIFHTHSSNPEAWDILGPGGQGANGGVDDEVAGLTWGYSENQSLQETGDWQSADYGVEYLKQDHGKPFFLAIGLFRPHLPFKAPKAFFEKFNLDEIEIPAGYLENDLDDTRSNGSNHKLSEVNEAGKWKDVIRAYLACIAFADANLGHLMEGLENSQYADNTIIVLIGDHGWHLGEKEHFQKFTLWDRAIKTPMIMFDPTIAVSGNSYHAVSLQDIYPTLISLTGLPQPEFPVRGRDLTPLLENPDRDDWCGAALTSYTTGHSLRTNRYRYTEYHDGAKELYDHKYDKWEWTNLILNSKYDSVQSALAAGLSAMLKNEEVPFTICSEVIAEEGTEFPEEEVPLNIRDKRNGSLYLKPNPANGIVSIVGRPAQSSVTILDSTGRVVLTDSKDELDVSSLPIGLYFVEVEGFQQIQRLIRM